MGSNAVGEIPVIVTADLSSLEQAINQAAMAAESGGEQIAGALQAGLQGAADAANALEQNLTGLGDTESRLSSEAQALVDAQAKLDQEMYNAQGIAEELRQAYEQGAVSLQAVQFAEQEAAKATDAANHAQQQQVESTESLVGSLASLAGALAIVETIKAFAEAALDAWEEQERWNVSMEALTGSTEAAAAALHEVEGISLTDALDKNAVQASAQAMTAFGFATEAIGPALQAAADAAAATGKSFDATSTALVNMAKSGMASSRQLVQLGLNTNDLARVMKVSAEEVKGAFKAMDETERLKVLTEALGKFAGVGAKVGDTMGGAFQRMRNAMSEFLESVGRQLEPFFVALADGVSKALLVLQGLVDAFGELPEPIKFTAEAIGGLTIAILAASAAFVAAQSSWALAGPALANIASTASTLGATVLPLLAQAALVAGAAFAAWKLGEWLYQNVAALHDFGDAVAELLLKIPGLASAMDRLSGATATLQRANSDLDFATQKLQASLEKHNIVIARAGMSVTEYAAALRAAAAGVSTIVSASDKAAEAAARHAKAVEEEKKNIQEAAEKSKIHKEALAALGIAAEGAAKQHENLSGKLRQFSDLIPVTMAQLAIMNAEYQQAVKAVAEYELALSRGKLASFDMVAGLEALQKSIAPVVEEIPKLGAAFNSLTPALDKLRLEVQNDFKAIGVSMNTAIADAGKMILAYEDLSSKGILSLQMMLDGWGKVSATLQRLAETDLPAAIEGFDRLIALAQQQGASEFQLSQMMQKRLETIIAIDERSGISATREIVALENLRIKQDLLAEATRNTGDMLVHMEEIGIRAFDQIGKGIADVIVSGKDFGDTMLGVLKSIEKEIVDTLVGWAFKELRKEILGTTGELGSLAKSFTNLFGNGGGNAAAGAAGGAAGTIAGPAAGGAGAAGGGGLMGAIGAIGMIATAISSIVGNFQMAKMETSLNAIEHNTRYAQIEGEELLKQALLYWPVLKDMQAFNNDFIAPQTAYIEDLMEQSLASLKDIDKLVNYLHQDLINLYNLIAGGGIPDLADQPSPTELPPLGSLPIPSQPSPTSTSSSSSSDNSTNYYNVTLAPVVNSPADADELIVKFNTAIGRGGAT